MGSDSKGSDGGCGAYGGAGRWVSTTVQLSGRAPDKNASRGPCDGILNIRDLVFVAVNGLKVGQRENVNRAMSQRRNPIFLWRDGDPEYTA